MAKKTSIEYYKEAVQSLRDSKQRKPVYLLYGEETFFLDLLQDEAIGLVPEPQKDFNLDLLYGNEVTPDTVLSIARSYPMMAEFRVVIVRDFFKLRGNEGRDGHIKDFLPYLENPNPTTLLLLIDNKAPDKRTKLGKALAGKGSVHTYSKEFEKLPEYKIPDWISSWVSFKYKKRINPGASQLLTQMAGTDLQVLSTEIDKVCTFVDTQVDVTVEHVKKIIGHYREYSVIELKDAVLARDLDQSFSIVEQMLLKSNNDTGEVIRTVGFFYSVFGNIWQIRRLIEKGMNKSSVQDELEISNTWYFNQLWKDASNYHLSEMPGIFEALLDADRAAKGFSTLDTPSILFLLVKRIAS